MRSGLPLLMVSVLLVTAVVPARGDDPLVEKVRKSIQDARGYLLGQQRPNGSWEISAGDVTHPGGATSLALLALLTSGENPKSEAIQNGLRYLRTIKPGHTYTVALQTMAFAQAGEAEDRQRIQRNVRWLIEAQQPTGWSYTKAGGTDNSNTQYAVLGLHAGIEAGVEVDKAALERIRKYMLAAQAGGGWSYKSGARPTMTMTCAGLCNLMITGMDLDVSKQHMDGGVIVDCGKYDENRPVADALRLLGAHFPPEIHPGAFQHDLNDTSFPFYCLYGIERTGRLTGRRFFGGHDWYEIGCRYLVAVQKDGYWHGSGMDGPPIVATSFSLLFLAKGRTPVLLTKLAMTAYSTAVGPSSFFRNARRLEANCRNIGLLSRREDQWNLTDSKRGVIQSIDYERLASHCIKKN